MAQSCLLLQSDDVSIDDVISDALSLRLVSKAELLAQPAVLQSCISLLVNAHYQTTPNDLLQLLADEACQLYLAQVQDAVVCCILTVEEGGLDADLIKAIQLDIGAQPGIWLRPPLPIISASRKLRSKPRHE